MNVTDVQKPPPASAPGRAACFPGGPSRLAAPAQPPRPGRPGRRCSPAAWPCGRRSTTTGGWAPATRADELPMILEGCAAGIIAVTTHSPFGEPERATGRRLPFLRAGLVLALCAAAIGFFALGAAVAYRPQAGVYLAGGILPVARNVLGMTGDRADLLPGHRRADRVDRPARLHRHLPVRADRELLRAADLADPAADRPWRLDRRHGRLRRRPDRFHHQGSPHPPVG